MSRTRLSVSGASAPTRSLPLVIICALVTPYSVLRKGFHSESTTARPRTPLPLSAHPALQLATALCACANTQYTVEADHTPSFLWELALQFHLWGSSSTYAAYYAWYCPLTHPLCTTSSLNLLLPTPLAHSSPRKRLPAIESCDLTTCCCVHLVQCINDYLT